MIRVLLVDDQELVRSGFRIILESEPGIEVVGEASNGIEAVAKHAELHPHVICMDVEMPEMDGIAASREILGGISGGTDSAAADAQTRSAILILTTFGHERYLFEALAAGVSGFLLKTSRAEQLIEAVQTLAGGSALLGADVTRAVIDRVANGPAAQTSASESPAAGPTPSIASNGTVGRGASTDTAREDAFASLGLTAREAEVLRHLAVGKSNGEIASALFLGESTVKTHVSNLLQKLGARDRIQAVVWAHELGIA